MQHCGVSWLLCSHCSVTSVTSSGLISMDLIHKFNSIFLFILYCYILYIFTIVIPSMLRKKSFICYFINFIFNFYCTFQEVQ